MQKDHSPPLVLPTVETPGYALPKTPLSPLSPGSPRGFATSRQSTPLATSSGAQLNAQPSFRRHNRKRSSTIFVQPRPAPPTNSSEEEIPFTSGLIRGVTTFAGAQLLAKLLAFVLNQLLIRFLGSRDLGVASQLDLLVGTALALSRDALRLSSQRKTEALGKSEYTTDGRPVLGTVVGTSQETVNLGWLAAALGAMLVSLISIALYFNQSWPVAAIVIAASAAIIELVAEPCFLLIQMRLQLEIRAKAESAANTVRVAMVAFSLLVLHLSPFIGFALGHLSYAFVLAVAYYSTNIKTAHDEGFSLLPTRLWKDQAQHQTAFISDSAWKTFVELGMQQVVKFFLVEGDKLAVGLMATLEAQGEYALAGNYGSLLARLVFLPVEEALRGYFTRVFPKEQDSTSASAPATTVPVTPAAAAAAAVTPTAPMPASRNASPPTPPIITDPLSPGVVGAAPSHLGPSLMGPQFPTTSSSLVTTKSGGGIPDDKIAVFTGILRVYTYLGILAAGFGPLVTGYLISFVVKSSKFAGVSQVLAAYACYIPVLAWNGTLEALVQSVASLRTLRRHGIVLSAIAMLFIVFTYIFVSFLQTGAVGIVWAQIIVMSLRAAWALRFATQYFERGRTWLRDCVPPWWVGLVSVGCIGAARGFVGEVHGFKAFTVVCLLTSPVQVAAVAAEYSQIRALQANLRGNNASVHSQLKLKQD